MLTQGILPDFRAAGGDKIPRSLGKTVHGKRPGEVLHFDFLYVEDNGPLDKDELEEEDGCSRTIL